MICFVINEGYEGRALRENTLPSLKVLKVHIHVFILFQCRSDNSYILVHSAVCDFVKLLKVLTDIKTGYNFIVYISTLPVFIEPWITKVVLKIYLKKNHVEQTFFKLSRAFIWYQENKACPQIRGSDWSKIFSSLLFTK